MTWHDKEQSKD